MRALCDRAGERGRGEEKSSGLKASPEAVALRLFAAPRSRAMSRPARLDAASSISRSLLREAANEQAGVCDGDEDQYRRIATEEAFATPRQQDAIRSLMARTQGYDPDVWLGSMQTKGLIAERLADLDGERLRIMDQSQIDMAVLAMTSTGVQQFEPDEAAEVATNGNDLLAEAIRRHPTRYAGLATIPVQDPKRAVKELERAITTAQAEWRDDQLAHQRRVSRRREVLADSRSGGRARRHDLHSPARAIAGDARALSALSARTRDLGLRGRNRPARREAADVRCARQVSEPADRHRAHGRERAVLAVSNGLDARAFPASTDRS